MVTTGGTQHTYYCVTEGGFVVITDGSLYADGPCWGHTDNLWDKVCPQSFLATHNVLMVIANGISVPTVIIGGT